MDWTCSTALVAPGTLDAGAEMPASARGTISAAADAIASPMSGISTFGMCSSIISIVEAVDKLGATRAHEYRGNPSERRKYFPTRTPAWC
jgi:hypothetical protein